MISQKKGTVGARQVNEPVLAEHGHGRRGRGKAHDGGHGRDASGKQWEFVPAGKRGNLLGEHDGNHRAGRVGHNGTLRGRSIKLLR